MAITFDASSETDKTGYNTTHNQNHTCTGSDLILLVGVCVFDSPYDVVTGITYNGVSMTQVSKKFHTGGRGTYLYVLTGPATGTNTVSISTSSSVRVGIDIVSFTGAAQSGQPESFSNQEVTSSTKTMTLTVSTDQSILVCSEFTNRTSSAGANTTVVGFNNNNNTFSYSTSPVGTGSKSLVLNQSDSTWAVQAFAVITPVATAGTTFTPKVMMF